MRVLLTGFEPFGGDVENASGDAVAAIRDVGSDVAIEVSVLPVSFRDAPDVLARAIADTRPDLVVAVGEAGRRSAITPESTASAFADARIADNDGEQPRGVPLDAVPGPLTTTFDVDRLAAHVREVGIDAHASHDAGTFVCNAVYRALLRTGVPGVFVHVPAVRTHGIPRVGAETDGSDRDADTDALLAPATDVPTIARALTVIIGSCAAELRRRRGQERQN